MLTRALAGWENILFDDALPSPHSPLLHFAGKDFPQSNTPQKLKISAKSFQVTLRHLK